MDSDTEDRRTGARRLTETGIQRMRAPSKGRIEIADALVAGLYLRVTEQNKRSWSVVYRVPGSRRLQRLTLGSWPAIGLADARNRAKDALLEAMAGKDPAAKKRNKEERRPDLFEDVAGEFVYRFLRPRQKRWQATEAIINNKLVKPWQGRPIKQITKPDVLKLLDQEMDAGRERMANQTHQLAGQLFRWASKRGYVENNPAADLDRPAKHRSRDRVLSETELAAIWRAAVKLGYPFGPFVQLLLLTGQRRNEVAGMLWSELDLDKRLWNLPSERTKNGRPHDVPISSLVGDLLDQLPRLGDRVFPSAGKNSKTSISGFSKAKRRLDKLILEERQQEMADQNRAIDEAQPLASWVLHDLRRTLVTGMAEIGLQPHIIEAVVNHVSGHKAGVAGIYNRATYSAEKREALERWAEHVSLITKIGANRNDETDLLG